MSALLAASDPRLSVTASNSYGGTSGPVVEDAARTRLRELQDALGTRTWIVGDDFSVADLMLSSVLKIAHRLELLDGLDALQAYTARCWERPAHREAIAEQCATIDAHQLQDMHYEALKPAQA